MIKVLCILGTRPEAIKMAMVLKGLRARQDLFLTRVCATAQHREMLDQVLGLFGIGTDYDLNIMHRSHSLSQLTSHMLVELEPVIEREDPDWILVQGDTTTAMAAALAGFYARRRVAHVEAGLRTFDKLQPYPEEINRRFISAVCDLHLAPTETARKHLLREGIRDEAIRVTGNTVVDALLHVVDHAFEWSRSPLATIPRDKRLVLVTAHRRENFGRPLHNICQAIKEVSRSRDDVHFIFPWHRNPNARRVVQLHLSGHRNITLLEPLDYLSMIHLMRSSYLILTDSGGLQEEAPTFGVPVLVLRNHTERPEAVEAGTARLVGTAPRNLIGQTSLLLDDSSEHARMSRVANPFGDGRATERVVRAILEWRDAAAGRGPATPVAATAAATR